MLTAHIIKFRIKNLISLNKIFFSLFSRIHILLLLIFCMSSLDINAAMVEITDGEAFALEEIDLNEQNGVSSKNQVTLVSLKNDLLSAIKKYNNELFASLGCGVVRGISGAVKSDKYKHVHCRMKILDKYYKTLSIINDARAIKMQIGLLINDMSDVKSVYGKAFQITCQDTQKKMINQFNIEDDPMLDHCCLLCRKADKIIAAWPCLDLVYCAACYEKSENIDQHCLICKKSIISYVLVKQLCNACQTNQADYIGKCGHMLWCEECIDQNENNPCSSCGSHLGVFGVINY